MARITRRKFISGTVALGLTATLPDLRFAQAAGGTQKSTRFYVVDSCGDSTKSRILIYDSTTGQRLGRLPARYHADLMVSRDGELIYVCDSVVLRNPPTRHPTAKVKIYDGSTLKRLQRIRAPRHPIYSVAPFTSAMALSDDGRYLYLTKRRLSPKGKPRYRVRVYDVQSQTYAPYGFRLPETPVFMSSIPGRTDLLMGFQGSRLEGIGRVNARTENRVRTLQKFKSPMRRGLEYMTAGIAIHQNGERAYAVTRNGRVRVLSIPGNSLLTDEFQLGIPPNSAIPLNQVLVWGKYLLVGVSTTSEASEGKADPVFVFDSTSFRLVDTYPLDLPSQQLALAPDGSKLYAASFSPHNCITTYSKGRKIASLQNAGRTMTRFVVANAP